MSRGIEKMDDLNIKNGNLYNKLLSLTKVILEILTQRIENNTSDLIVISEIKWVKRDDHFYTKQQNEKILWTLLIHHADDEIKRTNEYLDFANLIMEDNDLSCHFNELVGTVIGSRRLTTIELPLLAVSEFLSNTGIIDFDFNKFNAFYFKIEDFLYNQNIVYENITPLCGFTMECSELLLSENISIVRLTDDEILDIFNLGIKLGHDLGVHNLIDTIHDFAIKVSYKLPKIIGERPLTLEKNDFFTDKYEQAIINACRIYKNGALYPITTLRKSKNFLVSGVSYKFETPVKPFIHNPYKLLNSEIDDFKSFWNENESNLLTKKDLSVGLDRFSQSTIRDNSEDRIIDLMIASEAFFLTDGNSELQYKFAQRAAMYLGKNSEQKKSIFEFMKKIYEVRSKIVHGNTPKLPKKSDGSIYATLGDVCDDLEEYLRQTIKKIIHENDFQLIKDWDSLIFE